MMEPIMQVGDLSVVLETATGIRPLLTEVMRDGAVLNEPRPTFQQLQATATRNLAALPTLLAALSPTDRHEVVYSEALHQLRDETLLRLNAIT